MGNFFTIGLRRGPAQIDRRDGRSADHDVGADPAEIELRDTVAVLGCGPVGQFAICGAKLMDAGSMEVIPELTGGIGVDRVIDGRGGLTI